MTYEFRVTVDTTDAGPGFAGEALRQIVGVLMTNKSVNVATVEVIE